MVSHPHSGLDFERISFRCGKCSNNCKIRCVRDCSRALPRSTRTVASVSFDRHPSAGTAGVLKITNSGRNGCPAASSARGEFLFRESFLSNQEYGRSAFNTIACADRLRAGRVYTHHLIPIVPVPEFPQKLSLTSSRLFSEGASAPESFVSKSHGFLQGKVGLPRILPLLW